MWTLVGVHLSFMSDTSMVVAILPQLMRVFDLSPLKISLLISAYTVSAGCSGLLASFFLDRFDRKKALLFFLGGFVASTAFTALAPNFDLLLVARACTGIFGGVLTAINFSIVGDALPFERRGAASGKILSAFPISSVLTVPGGLLLANVFSWRAPFMMFSGFAAVVWLIAMGTVPSLGAHIKDEAISVLKKTKALLGNRNHLHCYGMMVLQMFAGFSVIAFFNPYLVANVQFSEKDIPLMYFIGGLFTSAMTPYVGKLVDRHGSTRIYRVVALVSLIPIYLYTNLTPSSFIWVIFITTLFMVFVSGRMVPFMAAATSAASMESRGSHLSFLGAIQQISVACAAGVSGWILTETAEGLYEGFDVVGYVAITASVLCMMAVATIRKHEDTPALKAS